MLEGKERWDPYSQIMLHPSAQSTQCNISFGLGEKFGKAMPLAKFKSLFG